MNRFDLEQQILTAWKVVHDIKTLVKHNAPAEDFAAVATICDYQFEELFATFEAVCFSDNQSTQVPRKQETKELEQELSTRFSEKLNQVYPVARTRFRDEDGRMVELSYGDYSGERILGIDTPDEVVSLRLDNLNTLIKSLVTLNTPI
ncbi:hypothetical protein UFOVP116_251 [uncultured Caudovirales phage]|uniref:Uncharacterized protein n=1 Tax=uncultured Caudovirales phage TaxID=2100421 RepID=A0A6J5L9U1_9CAUD|nr:hypothetical protein UFOVP116_251 [uncultured Caudovirales phage]